MRSPIVYVVIFLFLLRTAIISASDIRIGLFYGQQIQSVVFSVVEGEYVLSADNKQLATLLKGSILHMDYSPEGIVVNSTTKAFGVFKSLEFKGISSDNEFIVRPVFPSLNPKESDDDLLIDMDGENLRIINRLDLEKYIAGTIESEGGSMAPVEYYKAQAVLVRTYAVKNFHRHAFEGFNLCDGQHCQVFNGKSRWNDEIYSATVSTLNEVLVDEENQLATTPYHANCGGITSSASMAWNEDLPYLIPVMDPFCIESEHHQWSQEFSAAEWRTYLQKKGALYAQLPDNPTMKPERLKYFSFGNRKIPSSEIRQDLQLKSAFFAIMREGDKIVLDGRGYGHGVGLCQEGAMEMARVGYVYVDILMFYFHNLTLSQYNSEMLSRQ